VKANLATLGFGAAFGFVLGWARLAEPEVIYAMLRFREPDVYLLMGSAIATAAIGSGLLRRGGARTLVGGTPVSWRTFAPTRDHVMGSAVFGLGWSLSCTCPGPVAVQISRGEASGLFTAAGMLIGIAIRDAMRARASRSPDRASGPAREELPAVGL